MRLECIGLSVYPIRSFCWFGSEECLSHVISPEASPHLRPVVEDRLAERQVVLKTLAQQGMSNGEIQRCVEDKKNLWNPTQHISCSVNIHYNKTS